MKTAPSSFPYTLHLRLSSSASSSASSFTRRPSSPVLERLPKEFRDINPEVLEILEHLDGKKTPVGASLENLKSAYHLICKHPEVLKLFFFGCGTDAYRLLKKAFREHEMDIASLQRPTYPSVRERLPAEYGYINREILKVLEDLDRGEIPVGASLEDLQSTFNLLCQCPIVFNLPIFTSDTYTYQLLAVAFRKQGAKIPSLPDINGFLTVQP